MNFDQLNQVVKFSQEKEREAFEQAIRANPTDVTNHLVYADWLEENGQLEEAVFRRAIGNWFLNPWGKIAKREVYPITGWGARRPHPLDEGNFPEGVRHELIKTSPAHWRLWRFKEKPGLAYAPNAHDLLWPSYEHMEAAFRQAFRPEKPQ